jgi:hypothetical protein
LRKNLLFLKNEEESSFSEEKEAKRLLVHGAQGRCSTELHTKRTKVFCFFSSEKKSLPYLSAYGASAPRLIFDES